MHRLLIGGAWTEPLATAAREIRNPATLVPLGTVADCGAGDVERALRPARDAAARWRVLAPAERAARVSQVVAGIHERGSAVARLLAQESGRPLCEALDEVAAAEISLRRIIVPIGTPGACARDGGHGAAAVFPAFDAPLRGLAAHLGSALAAGEAVIARAPPECPLSSLALAHAFDALPAGLVSLLTGPQETAVALVAGEGITRIAAGGSRAARERIGTAARAAGKPLQVDAEGLALELVLADADLDLAAAGTAWAALRGAGQGGARTRIHAERAIAAAFADRLHQYVAFLEVGDPLKRDTDLGPLISHEAVRCAEEQVARALKDGARLKLGGRAFRPWGLPGHFFQPTILSEVRARSLADRDEILAPVLSIVTIEDADASLGATLDRYRDEGAAVREVAIYGRDSARVQRLCGFCDRAGARGEHVTARGAAWFPYRSRVAGAELAR